MVSPHLTESRTHVHHIFPFSVTYVMFLSTTLPPKLHHVVEALGKKGHLLVPGTLHFLDLHFGVEGEGVTPYLLLVCYILL